MKRILITGAAGKLGRRLRLGLKGRYATLRLTDIVPLGEAGPGEEIRICDLRDRDGVMALMEGVDAVVHFGGIGVEDTFDAILGANIVSTQNVYEAARLSSVGRIVYASSIHACGMYPRSVRLDAETPPRPDSLYGLSKAFGESLSRMYFDKHGLESACLRIGSCFERPTDERHLATWLSFDDMIRLVRACLDAPFVGWTVLYGASNNDMSWSDNGKVGHIGYRPLDNAQDYAAAVLAGSRPASPDDPAIFYQGGYFVSQNGGFTRKHPLA
jgi:uronate dehydrogenase